MLIGFVQITSLGRAVAYPLLLVLGLANYFLFDRPVVHERTGFRCRQCGYDLSGQVVSRCPECGSPFEMDDLARHKMAGPEKRSKVPHAQRWVFTALLIVVGTSVLAAGILYYKTARTRAARQQANPGKLLPPNTSSPQWNKRNRAIGF